MALTGDIRVDIKGADEIRRKLRALPEKVGRNAMRRALRKGAGVIRAAARANARLLDDPQSTASIEKNIAVHAGAKNREAGMGGPYMRIGVQGGARQPRGQTQAQAKAGGSTFYWRFLELGTRFIDEQPLLLTAALANGGRAMEATAEAMEREVDREVAKL